MSNSRMNNALAIGMNLYISKSGMRFIKNADPELYRKIKKQKRKR